LSKFLHDLDAGSGRRLAGMSFSYINSTDGPEGKNCGGAMSEILMLDCVVIGGGVVGLATARALAQAGRDVVLLEAEPMTGSITSSRNSEVIHAGLYYPTGSLKAELCVAGKSGLYDYCRERHIPHRQCGKLVVAASGTEVAYLEKLLEQAQANGVDDCRLIDGAALRKLEPEIKGFAALVSPSTGIIDSHRLMEAYIADIEAEGGTIVLNAPVLGGELVENAVRLSVGGRDPVVIEAKLVVNAAGLNAWPISAGLAGLDTATVPERHYAKGSYFSLTARAPASRLIYPVPEPGGLGVHLTLDLAGQARFGPDVEWVETIDYDVDPRRADRFYAAIRRYWPGLPDEALQPAYAGMRAKVVGPKDGGGGDFVIQGPEATGHPAYAALYGIESPGLTASMAIAEQIVSVCGGS
jgi:L-2-hydroxyglutarate oxidase LhgO